MGTSRGFLTYEELNEKLPDEVVSPDKLDSLLMMIDEMGIKLIDETDIGEFIKQPEPRQPQEGRGAEAAKRPQPERSSTTRTARRSTSTSKPSWPRRRPSGSTIRCACISRRWARSPCSPASRKSPWPRRSKSPARSSAPRCSNPTTAFRAAVEILQQVDDGDLPVRPHDEDQHRRGPGRQGHDRPAHPAEPRVGPPDARSATATTGTRFATAKNKKEQSKSCAWRSAAAAAAA